MLDKNIAFLRACFAVFLLINYGNTKSVDYIINQWRRSGVNENRFDPAATRLSRVVLENDFEKGALNPWYDESPGIHFSN